jgi:hypothetical protein
VNDSVVFAPFGVALADSRTVSGVGGWTNTDVTPVPTLPFVSRAVSVTVKVPPDK